MPYTSMVTPSQEFLETENVVFKSSIQPSGNYSQKHITSAVIQSVEDEERSRNLDDGINNGLWVASCWFGVLATLLLCYLGRHYFTTKQFSWAIIVNAVVLILIILSWNSLLQLTYNEDHAFQCPDGTIVTYGDSRDARGSSTMGTLEEFFENPPPEWCDESIVWLEELTGQYIVFFIALLAGIFAIPNAFLVYVLKSNSSLSVGLSQPKKVLNSTSQWYKGKNVWFVGLLISLIIFALLPIGPIESDVDKIPGSSFMMYWDCDESESITECRTDEDGDVRDSTEEYRFSLLVHFGAAIVSCIIFAVFMGQENGWAIFGGGVFALVSIFLALLWLYGTIALAFSEILAGNIPYILNLALVITSLIGIFKAYDAPSLNTPGVANTNSNSPNKTMAGGRGKIDHQQIKRLIRQYSNDNEVLRNYIHNSLPEPKESSLMNAIRHRRSEHQKKQQSKPKSLKDQGSIPSSEPASKDTDFLNHQGREKNPKSSNPLISKDSKGVITRTTSFSVVRIDKIAQIVEKTPTKDDFNQMFIDEITTMKALDDKNIEVGLIDYQLGDSPKIVTRYFGSHNLGDVIATANNRGKKILISELIKKVNAIHGAGWVHRDLKPDNIMVDKRPKGDHRFAEIIDYGIAMKVNRRQIEAHNTAGTAFFGHNSQKDNTFQASTGQDWFSLARIFALILRGVSIESLDAEIQMSRLGLDLRNEIGGIGFDEKVALSLQELIMQATKPSCGQNEVIAILSRIGKDLSKALR